MSNKDTMKRFVGGLMIGGLLLGGGGFALAAATDDNAGTQTSCTTAISGPRMPGMKGMNSELLQPILNSLVSAGTITQEQVNQILDKEKQMDIERQNMREQMQNMTQAEREAYRVQNKPERADMFTQLVTDGIMTQEQVDAIQAAIHDKMTAERQEQLSTVLSGLVEKNLITNDQSTAILNKITELQNARQDQMQSIRDMTPEQREAYSNTNKLEKVNPLAELVTDGTITQAQADEIAKVMPFGGGKGMGMQQGRGNGGGRCGQCAQGNSGN